MKIFFSCFQLHFERYILSMISISIILLVKKLESLQYFLTYQYTDALLFGTLLYNYYSYLFILAALVLLTSMLGSIILALSTTEKTISLKSLTPGILKRKLILVSCEIHFFFQVFFLWLIFFIVDFFLLIIKTSAHYILFSGHLSGVIGTLLSLLIRLELSFTRKSIFFRKSSII